MTHTVRRRLTRSSHVGDRPVPHSLSALLTPTRAPHARLLKHWESRIVSLLALVRYHTRTTCGACSLAGLHASSLARFFPRALQLSLSFWLACPLAFFFSSERTSNSLYICGPSRRAQSPPKLTPPHLRIITMTTHALEKGRASALAKEICAETLLRKNKGGCQHSRKKCV